MADETQATNADMPTPEDPANPAGGGADEASNAADEAQAALMAAFAAVAAAEAEATPAAASPRNVAAAETARETASSIGRDAKPFQPPMFSAVNTEAKPAGLDLLGDVDLHVSIELGRTRMLVEDVLKLGDGAVVELDKLAGDPVDVYVNGRHVARGEVLVLNDNFCVRVNEIIDPLSVRDED